MSLSQAASSSSGILSHLLTVISVCVLGGLLIAMRWGVKRLRTLLSDVTGPWLWVGRILDGVLVLAFALFIVGVALVIFSLATR